MMAPSSVQSSNAKNNSDYFAIWALVDSGSSVHAINADKILPNARKQAPPKGHKGFRAANGQIIPHGGIVSAEVKFEEGNTTKLEWNNANVEMPILSTKKLNRDGGRTIFDDEEGWILNKHRGFQPFHLRCWRILLQASPSEALGIQ